MIEIDRSEITIEADLGKGAFGVVSKGLFSHKSHKPVPCALKQLKVGNYSCIDYSLHIMIIVINVVYTNSIF